MTRSSYGSIRRLPSGRYQARVTIDGRMEPLGTFRTRREAATAMAEASHPRPPERPPRMTVAEFCDHWWTTRAGHRPSTRARDRQVIDHDLLPVFGPRPLDGITPMDVQGWVNALAAVRAPSTVRRSFVILYGVLVTAVDAGLIPVNPAGRARLPKAQRTEMRFLAPAELETLAETIGSRWRTMILTMAYATLRLGEAAGLRRVDIDPLHSTLRVANNVVEVGGRLHEGPPKTAAGRRTMTMPASVMAELDTHLSRFSGHPYMFPWDDGGPLRAEEWRRRFWRPAVATAGLAPLRPHDLKHTGVALLAAAGAGAAEIARRAGHTDPGFTLRTYGHLLPGVDRLAAERLDALRSSVVDSTLVARQWHAELDRHPGLPVGDALTWDNGTDRFWGKGRIGSTPDAQGAV
jgi:integrase